MAFLVRGGAETFRREAGGHRWQRVPPTERRGRVHTSTVTVAVLEPAALASALDLRIQDVEVVATRGTGPGGQHRNTTNSCIVATHRPTGLSARVDLRSQHQSKEAALWILNAKVRALREGQAASAENATRRQQIGSGMRGDKVRTYRTQDDRVTDHRTGETWRLSAWAAGHWTHAG